MRFFFLQWKGVWYTNGYCSLNKAQLYFRDLWSLDNSHIIWLSFLDKIWRHELSTTPCSDTNVFETSHSPGTSRKAIICWRFVQVWFIVKFSQRSYQYIWDLVHVKHHMEHLSAKFSHMSWIYIDWHRIVYGNFNHWCPGYNNEPTLEVSCDM